MPNILEFLRGMLVDPEAQRVFRDDDSGFGDLTGEDVVEAIAVLRRSLPDETAAALDDFADPSRLPPIRPRFGERDLDAAVRMLHHAVDRVTAAGGPPPAPPSPFEQAPRPAADGPFSSPSLAHEEPIAVETDAELAVGGPAAAPDVSWPPHPDSPASDEPIAAEGDADLPPAPVEPAPSFAAEPVAHAPRDVSGLPSVQQLDAALASAADEARTMLADYAAEVRERLGAALAQADVDAADIKVDAERLRAEADADRAEAARILDDAQRHAEEVRAEVQRGQDELEARRTELRDAERELRERMAGLDSVFRTVLRDDQG